jgi:ankyrin repeat protein
MYNFEAVVKLLLATNGVELDSKDNTGRTPLAWASDNGHEVVVKLLLAKDGVDPDLENKYGRTPLSWAAANGHEAVVKLLLESHGIDPDPKHTAVRHSPTRCLGFGIIACCCSCLLVNLVDGRANVDGVSNSS